MKDCSKAIIKPHRVAIDQIGLPELELSKIFKGGFDYNYLFVKAQTQLKEDLPRLNEALN